MNPDDIKLREEIINDTRKAVWKHYEDLKETKEWFNKTIKTIDGLRNRLATVDYLDEMDDVFEDKPKYKMTEELEKFINTEDFKTWLNENKFEHMYKIAELHNVVLPELTQLLIDADINFLPYLKYINQKRLGKAVFKPNTEVVMDKLNYQQIESIAFQHTSTDITIVINPHRTEVVSPVGTVVSQYWSDRDGHHLAGKNHTYLIDTKL